MPEFFVLLSGENQPLGRNEIESLLEMRGVEPNIVWLGRLGIFRAENDITEFLRDRAAMTKYTGTVIDRIKNLVDEGIKRVSETEIERAIQDEETFRIRTQSLDSDNRSDLRKKMIVSLGDRIRAITGSSVSLENPDVEFRLFVIGNTAIICKSMQSNIRSNLVRKQSTRLSSFHPSVMNALVARAMCNLAKIEKGDIVFDPYCGVGGILFEALEIGCKVIGGDIAWLHLQGAKRNLSDLKNVGFSIIQGDARSIPLSSCDSIVTDPPYGRASSTFGLRAENLVSSLFQQISRVLSTGGRACICSCSEMPLEEFAKRESLSIERKTSIRVHRSLTREIIVLKN